MITPVEIENKKFNKKVIGYDILSVDEFVSQIANDYEKMYKENISLKDKDAILSEALQQYRTTEDALKNTLLIAQSTGEEVKKNASEKAALIIREAENKAREILESARHEILEYEKKNEAMKKNFEMFRIKLQSMLKTQLDIVNEIEFGYDAKEKLNSKNNGVSNGN